MKRIRVLYYEYPGPGIGGSRRSLLNLIRGLGDHVQAYIMGDLPEEVLRELPETTVVLPVSSIWPPKRPESLGRVRRTLLWWCYFLSTAARLVWVILRYGIDVVHGNNDVTSNATAILAAKLTGRPCVCHLRGVQPPWRETRWLFRHVDHYIAICKYVGEYYVQKGLIRGQPLSIIYNGIDVQMLGIRSTRRSKPVNTRLMVGWFGRIAWDKGLEYFFHVASETLKRTNDVEFVVHGPVPSLVDPGRDYYDRLRALRRRLGLENAVCFGGAYSDLVGIMQETDVAICCSPNSNFSRILFEAMVCGVPVVAFDTGGVREVAVSGKNCLLVPNKNAEAMAEAIIRLRTDEQLRDTIIHGGTDTAGRLFDARANASAVLKIYRRLLQ